MPFPMGPMMGGLGPMGGLDPMMGGLGPMGGASPMMGALGPVSGFDPMMGGFGPMTGGLGPAFDVSGLGQGGLGQVNPQGIHITQEQDPTYNPNGLKSDADCGPTSLAMGLNALGLQASGAGADPARQINATRLSMFTDPQTGQATNTEKNGVDPYGNFSAQEHQTTTGLDDIARGAINSGANATRVQGMDQIRNAVQSGNPVVVLGNIKNEGSYRAGAGLSTTSSGAGGHFALVSGYNQETNTYTVNDPNSKTGPVQVTAAELQNFLNSDQQGVALSRGDGQAVGGFNGIAGNQTPAAAGQGGQSDMLVQLMQQWAGLY